MKLRIVQPSRGAWWVRQGFRVFFRQPLAFTALFFLFLFGAFIVLTLPLLGGLLMLALLPVVTLGFMIGTRESLLGRFPLPGVFLAPFRQGAVRIRSLLLLGVAYALASLGIMTLADWVDGGSVAALQDAMGQGEASREMMDDPRVQSGLMLRLVLTVPLSLLFWHAPALIHWAGVDAPRAVFFSIVACWRNKWAFLVYAFTWAFVVGLFGVFATLFFSLLDAPQLVSLAAFPAALMFSTVFYVSLYFTFVDCFESLPLPVEPDRA
ncbi:MAG TPA: BPSS1780 family membrane protein [Burkholderiaceae bacterium]|nr:BPSS1780 family membrane protein [Burkholderiaceae bacterium]